VPQPELTCLIVADDLTGACDAGVQFAARGSETAVRLWKGAEAAEIGADRGSGGVRGDQGVRPTVLAVSTESRVLAPRRLPSIFADAARRLPAARLLFKKIDSTLRGNVGAEVALAARAFGCETAVIAPAFPAMGRTVVDGLLRVAANAPVELARYWREQRLPECVHRSPAGLPDALAAGARFVSLDAGSDEDLDSIAAAGLSSDRRILWAGSGGLAAALARALGTDFAAERRQDLPQRGSPAAVLFCIGSSHAATVEQARRLAGERRACSVKAEAAEPGEIAAALEGGRHVALRVPCGRVAVERLARLLGGTRAPLAATGGFTASLVWQALGVEEVRLRAEVSPGIPLGVIHGGMRDGAPLVTKSGGFGGPRALIQIADYFLPL
jgi:D-threonate/D-erythronate kinase